MFKSDKALYLNADKSQVVEEGSPDAAFLLVGAGSEIDDADAKKYGLKSSGKTEDKAVAGPEEDKAAEAETTDDDDNLESLKKDELVARAEAAGLDTSGTKADLIERLTSGGE